MNRRTFLTAGAVSLSATAGCLGVLGGGGTSGAPPTPDDDDVDGRPPAFDDQPDEREVDTDSFGTVEESGVDVPLAPIDVAHYWYKRGEARFADARSQTQYEASHIYGAVLSQADANRRSDDDPVADWPRDERVVCYCGCPHHLSSIRASELIQNDFEEVYVIDEGFWEWHDREYPMRGSDVETTPANWVVDGEVAASFAGENAWARHRPSGQMESTDIGGDGRYELHLKFNDVGPDSTIEVDTPAYTVEGKLSDLATGTVQG
ncbi:rhodanese-like domain-containing protein [Halorussus halobius]|uniref:rhodanese-like domain-containing protein n=1 Tax=Halorussus halobius TaxID=1710537 RepID=UPI001091D03D|nr:rhodanese-like domain-containing protein [Halorussus halobius]